MHASSPYGASPPFRQPADTVPQDWTALARHLAASGHELGRAPPRQFAGGFGNLNYLVEFDGRPAVLRRPPSGPLPPGANDMAREHRILANLWRAYELAPRSLHFCADPAVLGAPFQIIEHRAGIVIRERVPPPYDTWPEVGAILSRHLVESLAALHAVDAAAIGLGALGRPVGFLGRTLEGWALRGGALGDELTGGPAFAETLAWLRRHVPSDGEATLLHSDFKLDNLILDEGSLAPAAVIDWDMGTRGDPLWDLAVMLSYWSEPGDPDCMKRMRQMPTAETPPFWSRREALAHYLRITGRDAGEFRFFRALSVFRSAIVFLQLFDRWRRDPAGNQRAAAFDRLGREMLDFAFDIASGRAD